MFIKLIKNIFSKIDKNPLPKRSFLYSPYLVKYLTSFGAMTINESEYRCFACCKYHAYLQFIVDTKDEFNHYSARENRTPMTYSIWKDDIVKEIFN